MTNQAMDSFFEGVRLELNADSNLMATNNSEVNEAQSLMVAHLNLILEKAVNLALDSGCKTIQDALGIEAGDYAGMFFSGDNKDAIKTKLGGYLLDEIAYGQAVVTDDARTAAKPAIPYCIVTSNYTGSVFAWKGTKKAQKGHLGNRSVVAEVMATSCEDAMKKWRSSLDQ